MAINSYVSRNVRLCTRSRERDHTCRVYVHVYIYFIRSLEAFFLTLLVSVDFPEFDSTAFDSTVRLLALLLALLQFPYDGFHLNCLDVLVEVPFLDAVFVLLGTVCELAIYPRREVDTYVASSLYLSLMFALTCSRVFSS